MPRAAYLIPGRGGLWAGWRRDVRRFRRRRFRRLRRLRSPGWVAAVGRATHPRPTRDNIDRLLGWLIPCFGHVWGVTEHPTGATDMILSQNEDLSELSNSRWVPWSNS